MQEFNKGVYDYIIATDEADGRKEEDTDNENNADEREADDEEEDCECDQHCFL